MIVQTMKAAALLAMLPVAALAAGDDWSAVSSALGKTGAVMPGEVYRVGFPRSDLHVTLDGLKIKPTLALGGWLAFHAHDGEAMVMGDLVLTGDEVNPVMKKLAEGGIEITAVHNHLLRAEPATFYMHVLGNGDLVKLAATLHEGLAQSHTPFAAAAPPAPAPAPLDLDTGMIDRTLGAKGSVAGGVYQLTIKRAEGYPGRRHGGAGRHGLG
jgi:hypothetical protein